MRVFGPDEEIPADARGRALALGNFDGVHLGHRAVIGAAAQAGFGPPAVAVFEPHPRLLFQPDAAPFRLQSPGQRARALAACGVAMVFELRFDRALASLTDEGFCTEVLSHRLGAAHVAVGGDFRFGKGRMGDVESLTRHGAILGFGVTAAAAVDLPEADNPGSDEDKVSSTAIRTALRQGDMTSAKALLGRAWAIEGVVGLGQQRGRTIAFPTANVALGAYVRPAFGVYAITVDVGDGAWRPGVANIGVRPTVGAPEPLLEAHIFDFEGDLYGRRIEVRLEAFLRGERKFENFEALSRQIAADAAEARALLFV
jgi:riboflavin kinase/FMN adenylyltransferase